MEKEITDVDFREYNGSSLNVPLQKIKNAAKFTKVRIENPIELTSTIAETKVGTDSGECVIRKPNRVSCEPEKMKNHLIFERNLKYFRYYGLILGVHVTFHWKPGFVFCFNMFLFILLVTQLTYTQYLHIKNGNYYRILETLACYGITITMILKLVVFIKHYKAIKALMASTISLCKQNDSGCRGDKIRAHLLYNSRFYVWTALGVMAALSMFFTYPTKAFFVDDKWIPLLPIEYMFVDSSTFSGFIMTNIISSAMGLIGNFAIVYSVLLFVSIILNYTLFVDVFEEDVKYLDKMWISAADEPLMHRRAFLRNICRKQQDMNEYVKEIKRLLDNYIYYYFITSYLGQIICLFQIVVSDWKSGYAVAYGMFMEMMFYCLMGTKLSSENDRITNVLQQSHWYLYDQQSQKLFLFLLMATTNSYELWIGPLAPLSVLSGTKVIKSIYTYYNILIEVA